LLRLLLKGFPRWVLAQVCTLPVCSLARLTAAHQFHCRQWSFSRPFD
jgi:hypothetical protein